MNQSAGGAMIDSSLLRLINFISTSHRKVHPLCELFHQVTHPYRIPQVGMAADCRTGSAYACARNQRPAIDWATGRGRPAAEADRPLDILCRWCLAVKGWPKRLTGFRQRYHAKPPKHCRPQDA